MTTHVYLYCYKERAKSRKKSSSYGENKIINLETKYGDE